MHFLDAVQVEQLAEAIDPRYRLLVLVGAYTGLRPGEITGLKVKRLDLLRGKIEVAEALSEVDGKLTRGTPKNHERRVVRLARFLCDELAAYLAGRSHEPDDLVFAAPRAAGRSASTSSWSAPSSRRRSRPGSACGPSAVGTARCWSPTCGCMTSGTRPRRCRSARAPRSRRCSASSDRQGMSAPHEPSMSALRNVLPDASSTQPAQKGVGHPSP
jgi:integrase